MAKKKKQSEVEGQEIQPEQETIMLTGDDEPMTSEMIDPDKPSVQEKVSKDFSNHPKFSKFRGDK